MGERKGTKGLELWCRRMTEGYPGVKVENMTTSWRDGLAFCALIHHFRPELIDFPKLKKNDVYYNNELAFTAAEKYLGIPALLEAEDMVEYAVPDRLSILTYLSQFYRVFGATHGSPSRLVPKRPADPADRGLVSPESTSPPTKMVIKSVGTPRRDPCAKCSLPVFIAERLNVGKLLYHRTCFRCARCNSQLTLANYYETETKNQFCCEICPDEEVAKKKSDCPKIVVARSLSDEEKFEAGLKKYSEPDDYSAEFETALEDPNLSKTSSLNSVRHSEFLLARSNFVTSQIDDVHSDSDGETPPELPKSKPPDIISDIADGSEMDSPKDKPKFYDRAETDEVGSTNSSSLVKTRMRLFEEDVKGDIPNLGTHPPQHSKNTDSSVTKSQDQNHDVIITNQKSTLNSLLRKRVAMKPQDAAAIVSSKDADESNGKLKEPMARETEEMETSSVPKTDVILQEKRKTGVSALKDLFEKSGNINRSPSDVGRDSEETKSPADEDSAHSLQPIDDVFTKSVDSSNLIHSQTEENLSMGARVDGDESKPTVSTSDAVIIVSDDSSSSGEVKSPESVKEESSDNSTSNAVIIVSDDSSGEVKSPDPVKEESSNNSTSDAVIVISDNSGEEEEEEESLDNSTSDAKSAIVISDPSLDKSGAAITAESLPKVEYPEDLNPFGDDDSNGDAATKSLNPFDEDDEVGGSNSFEAQNIVKSPLPKKRTKIMPDKNLFDSPHTDTPEYMRKIFIQRISIGPSENDKVEEEAGPVQSKPRQLKLISAPRISLNPFLSDDDDDSFSDEEDNAEKPVPKPRKSKNVDQVPQPTPRKSNLAVTGNPVVSSSTSLSSASSGGPRKKNPAPKPPGGNLLDKAESSHSSLTSSPSTSVQHSPGSTPKTKKSKKAPPPPSSTPCVSTLNIEEGSLNISPIVVNDKLDPSTLQNVLTNTTRVRTESESKEWENEKNVKDEVNRNRQSRCFIPIEDSASPDKDYPIYSANKSTYGKWKRRKGPAPSRPVPQRRTIKSLPVAEVRRELDLIELQQQGLEKQGVRLEQIIRDRCEGPDSIDEDSSAVPIDVEDLILQLFEVVNEKNELCRRQAELMYLQRQQRLEEEHADVEYQIRCLMLQPEANKPDSDKAREEELINRLVEIVERRNEIIECLDMDRIREAEEDDSISNSMNSYATKRDEMNVKRGGDESDVGSKKSSKKKIKKDKKGKAKNTTQDMDKDIDESEPVSNTLSRKQKKKKKFSIF